MVISKVVKTQTNNNLSMFQIEEFWVKRGFQMHFENEMSVKGKRGSIIGNLFSFDMSKLITDLTVTKKSDEEIYIKYEINTIMQYITKLNRRYWDIEIETFEDLLNDVSINEGLWEKYYSEVKKQAIMGTIVIVVIFIGISLLYQTI